MDEELRVLFERADKAIAESKRLADKNDLFVAETKWWLQRLHWIADEMKPINRQIQR